MKRSVQFVNIIAAVALWASAASAATYYTCSPVFLANPQGRPLANSSVSVTNLDGTPPVNGVWNNASGTQAFQNTMPSNQILQVFADPGTYLVRVNGDGITKMYNITCGIGAGPAVELISIDRTADMLLLTTTSPPISGCVVNKPCTLSYDADTVQVAVLDFIMPSRFPLTFQGFLLSWHPILGGTGSVVWSTNWCTYANGTPPCDPTTASNKTLVVSATGGAMNRVDALFGAGAVPSGAWPQGVHVVMAVSREAADSNDTLQTPAAFENIQMEFSR